MSDVTTKHLVHKFKYSGRRNLGGVFARLLKEQVQIPESERPDLLVTFVPMSWQRYWQKQYNQAAVLAAELARTLGLPCRDLLSRKHRPRQVELSGIKRRQNLHGAFNAKFPLFETTVILVDDVVTTGSTMMEAAKALRAAGAKKIIAVSIC